MYAYELPDLRSAWPQQQLEMAAHLVEVAANSASVPPGCKDALHAAAKLASRVMMVDSSTAAAPNEHETHRAIFADGVAACMYRIGSATVAAATVLAVGGGLRKQEAADDLLLAVTRLCSWLLSGSAAASHADMTRVLQHAVQQQLAVLLSDGGPVAIALTAASVGPRTELAGDVASRVRWALQRSDTGRLPPLAVAACLLRMLCDGSGNAPLPASCLRTQHGRDRLRNQVRVLLLAQIRLAGYQDW